MLANKLNRKNEKPLLTDTSGEATAVYYRVLRNLDLARRARISFQLSDNLRRIVEDGIRSRHPEYNRRMVKRELFRLMLGDTLFNQVSGRLK